MKSAADVASGSVVLRSMRIGEHALFAGLLSIGAVRAAGHTGQPALVLVMSAVLALWYAVGVWAAARRKRRVFGRVWLAVLIALWLGLLALSVEFSWLAFALFFLIVHLLDLRIAIIVVGVLTGAVVTAQVTTAGGNVISQVLGPCLGALVAVGLAIVYQRLAHESEQRRRLVQQLMTAQADLIAVHDELAETQREAGATAERARIAREIHDTLAQGFSSIVLLSRAGLAGSRDVSALFTQIESTASENLDEARRVMHALTPAALEHGSLQGALQRLSDRLSDQTGIDSTVTFAGDARPIPTAHEVALLRLAQSALANVRQHAWASRVAVTLSYENDLVRLDVVDDGRGFDFGAHEAQERGSTGFGLRAMRERLADLSGTVEVESHVGEGTAVSATIPFVGGTS